MIFIDAGAFIARYRESDACHSLAVQGWKRLEQSPQPCFTSNMVIAEAATGLGRYSGGAFAADRLAVWLSSSSLTILRSDQIVELAAIALLRKYADQKIGFVDCISFALMQRHKLKTVFGFDRHFEAAGFRLWPAAGGKQ